MMREMRLGTIERAESNLGEVCVVRANVILLSCIIDNRYIDTFFSVI